jgi:ATP-binding cassette, subfamily C, bacterial
MKLNIRYFPSFIKLSINNSILLLLFSFMSALTQMLTAVSIIPVLRELDKNFELDGGVLEKIVFMYDSVLKYLSIESNIVVAIMFMLISLTLFSTIAFYIDIFSSKASALIVRQLRVKVIKSLMSTSWSYFSKHGSSDAVNHIITEATKISSGYKKVIETLSNTIQALSLIIFSLTISDNITFVMLSSALLVIIMFIPLLTRSKKLGERQRVLLKSATSSTLTSFDNIKSIKAMSIGHFSDILTNLMQKLEKNTYLLAVTFAITSHYRIPITVMLIAILSFVLIPAQELYYASLVPLVILFERIIKSIGYAQNSYQSFLKSLPFYISFEGSILKMEKNKEIDSENSIQSIEHIRFDNVTYSYSSIKVLEHISITFDKPSINLIIGKSGSGKTTFIDLIIGLIKPDTGNIFVNTLDLSSINLKSYRQNIGFVPQEVLLFKDSLRNNVALGRTDFSDSDIMHALSLANLMDLFNSLPNGLDSNLGEDGRLLSGGQRQRVLIARALLSKPSLLIFDEPTSGLDHESTLSFIRLLNRIKEEAIVFIISHDLVMQDHVDNIFKVENCTVKAL